VTVTVSNASPIAYKPPNRLATARQPSRSAVLKTRLPATCKTSARQPRLRETTGPTSSVSYLDSTIRFICGSLTKQKTHRECRTRRAIADWRLEKPAKFRWHSFAISSGSVNSVRPPEVELLHNPNSAYPPRQMSGSLSPTGCRFAPVRCYAVLTWFAIILVHRFRLVAGSYPAGQRSLAGFALNPYCRFRLVAGSYPVGSRLPLTGFFMRWR
jgi:hypothetical protein